MRVEPVGASRFSPEQRARAVRMVVEATPNYPTQWPAIVSVAEKIGVSAETLRKWVRQAAVDGGGRPGPTTEEAAELRRANEILKAASTFFAAELDRPQQRW